MVKDRKNDPKKAGKDRAVIKTGGVTKPVGVTKVDLVNHGSCQMCGTKAGPVTSTGFLKYHAYCAGKSGLRTAVTSKCIIRDVKPRYTWHIRFIHVTPHNIRYGLPPIPPTSLVTPHQSNGYWRSVICHIAGVGYSGSDRPEGFILGKRSLNLRDWLDARSLVMLTLPHLSFFTYSF